MSEKRLDRCGRWRNVIVAFRVSKEEGEAIDEAVALSGHSKQDYIISKLLNREVVVEKSPRTYKLLKDKNSCGLKMRENVQKNFWKPSDM